MARRRKVTSTPSWTRWRRRSPRSLPTYWPSRRLATSLQELLGRVGGAWHTAVSTHPDPRGIRVAFASRLPITSITEVSPFAAGIAPVQSDDHGATATATSRGVLNIAVTIAGIGPVQLVTTHMKSKLLTYPNGRFQPRDEDERARFGAYALYKRAAEAATVRTHMTQLLGGNGQTTPALLVGDMNDEPEAATTQILLGPPGSEIGTAGETIPDNGDAARLFNLAPKLPPEQHYSRIYRGRKELIDHILVSHALVAKALSMQSGTGVATGPTLRSMSDNPKVTATITGSDHSPITARFAT
jgi:hypothetical protein